MGCSRHGPKIPHEGFSSARKVRKAMIRKYGDSARALEVFWCPECGNWLIGRPNKRRKKNERGRKEDLLVEQTAL